MSFLHDINLHYLHQMAEEYILMKVFAASGNAIEVDGSRTKIFLCERQKCLKIGIYQYK